jgi:hypothetical protein
MTLVSAPSEHQAEHQSDLTLVPLSQSEELEIFEEWQRDEIAERANLTRRNAFRERIRTAMPDFNGADLAPMQPTQHGEVRHNKHVFGFWSELRPQQRVRVCHALAVVYLEGFSNATVRDLRASLYRQGILRANHWNALILLLGRFDARALLLRFHQFSQVTSLDILKATK